MAATLDDLRRLAADEHGLVVVATTRPDGSVQTSVVNAGVLDHPVTGEPVLGLVAQGGAAKLANVRRTGRCAVVARSGWRWASVEGPAEICGPDDPLAGVDPAAVPQLLRDVFTAAGGTHDDWAEYDRVMAAERRAAVLVRPERLAGVP